MMPRIFSALVLAVVLAVPGLLALGCDSMTDYPHNGEATDRSDTLKTGSGMYGGTNSAYENVPYEPSNAIGADATNTGTSGPGMGATGSYGGTSVGGSNTGNTPSNSTTGPNTEGR